MISFPREVRTLGAAVRYLRLARGMTLRAVAKAAGISAPFLSDIEHNRRGVSDKFGKLAAVLGTTNAELDRFRLTADIAEWIKSEPEVLELLRNIKRSARDPGEINRILFSPVRYGR